MTAYSREIFLVDTKPSKTTITKVLHLAAAGAHAKPKQTKVLNHNPIRNNTKNLRKWAQPTVCTGATKQTDYIAI